MKSAMSVGGSSKLTASGSLSPTPTLPRREREQTNRYASFTVTKWLLVLLLGLSAACAFAEQEAKPFVRGSHQQIISARAGKPFVIAFWSLTCTNCRDDLALFGRLAKKHRNLDLVLVATDSPEQKQEIASTLQHYRLGRAGLGRIESWVFADSYAERLRFEVDTQWYGELPRTYFFGADGRSTAVSGKIDHGQFEHWIKSGMHDG